LEIIKYLADKLAQKVDMTPVAARGLLKLSIKDKVGPFKPYNQLNFEDLEQVIQDSLKERLKDINVENVDEIINFLKKKLTDNQSLITMGSV